MTNGISKLIAIIYLYLANTISARQFVNQIDMLVSDDKLSGLPADCQKAFDILHENLALCAWDDQTYSEASDIYIKEPEMKKAVKEFISSWGKLMAQYM